MTRTPLSPVYVTSKARPDGPTFATLDRDDIPYTIVVEPQDVDAYQLLRREGVNLFVLDADDQGLAFARSRTLDSVRDHGGGWYWMLDDDISGFHRTNAGTKRNEPVRAFDALWEAETWLHEQPDDVRDGIGIVALEYQQFAWNATPGRPTWNSYTDVATLINSAVPADYRTELPLKGDRDFTLQVLAAGFDTARLRWLSFSVPTNGSNKGGLHDVYDSLTGDGIRREEWASRRLAELWPGVVEYKVKPNGRPDAKIHWRRLRGQQAATLTDGGWEAA